MSEYFQEFLQQEDELFPYFVNTNEGYEYEVVRHDEIGHLCSGICVGKDHICFSYDIDKINEIDDFPLPHGQISVSYHVTDDNGKTSRFIGVNYANTGKLNQLSISGKKIKLIDFINTTKYKNQIKTSDALNGINNGGIVEKYWCVHDVEEDMEEWSRRLAEYDRQKKSNTDS